MSEFAARMAEWPKHPQRDRLLAEAHARPYLPLSPPLRVTRFATLGGEVGQLAALSRMLGAPEPDPGATWGAAEGQGWRLRWERHTEFSTWTFFHAREDDLPAQWLDSWPGELLVATAIELRAHVEQPARLPAFGAEGVGARLSGGAASLYTDLKPDAAGLVRFVMIGHSADPPLLGRIVRAVLEIETYRMMALLAFPLAGEAGETIRGIEQQAAELTRRLAEGEAADDRALLSELATLAARAEALRARTGYRFGAARAYHEIVRDRIATLREERIAGLQTLGEFMERRLGPAMRTCDSIAQRQREAVERIARTEQLLNIRVQVATEAASIALLQSMDRRAEAQLRLQRTVEGLSVAAISYYAVGLLLYVLGAFERLRPGFDAALWAGLAVPVVVATTWLLLRRMRQSLLGSRDG